MGPNTASHGGGARASPWELPKEEEIFLKGSTRSWPDLSPLSPHPHDRLQFNGTQAWDSAPHKLAKTSALKNQLRAHGLNIGFELAATKKNALVPEFGDRHNLSKLSCGKACSVRKIRMTGYSWRGQVTRNKCERKCETPNEIGVDCSRARDGVDRHMCGRNANDWLDSRMERRTDAEEHESKPAQKRRIISREWGREVINLLAAAEISKACESHHFAQEVVHRGLVHPHMPIPACCATLRDRRKESAVANVVLEERGKTMCNIEGLASFPWDQEPLAVEIALMGFQIGLFQNYHGQTSRRVHHKDDVAYRHNRKGRVQVLAKEKAKHRLISLSSECPLDNTFKH